MVPDSWVNLTEANEDYYPPGTVLRYICDDGYVPAGPTLLTCSRVGQWSSLPPECMRSSGKRLIARFSDVSMFSHCLHSNLSGSHLSH